MSILLGLCLLFAAVFSANAHSQSTAFLNINAAQHRVSGEWHLALRDLEDAVGLDVDEDGSITWEELRSRKKEVYAYALSHLRVQCNNQPCSVTITNLLVENHSDGAYAVLRFEVTDSSYPKTLSIEYRAMFEIDSRHRALMRLQEASAARLSVFSCEVPVQRFDLSSNQTHTSFFQFVREGIWHIWSGYDHILFLLALLLPGVLRRRDGDWQPLSAAGPAVANVLKVVTAFTAAHSITLSLAAAGAVQLPARLIEAAIAASVVVAALNNLKPCFGERNWVAAFGFGLLHGFGFANALHDLGLQHGQMALTLFGFNLGVEIGQLAIVMVFLPLALSLRRLLFYPRVILRFGSAAIVLVSAMWLAERLFDFKWLPF